MAYVEVHSQGRIVVPSGLRPAFRTRKPPFQVLYSLAGTSCVRIQPADAWPPPSERSEVARALKQLEHVDPATLPSDHLEQVQDFARFAACRYLDGNVDKAWQVRIPKPVLAWLGLSIRRTGSTKRTQRTKENLPSLIVLGNVGSLEVWSAAMFKDAAFDNASRFPELLTKAMQALLHASR